MIDPFSFKISYLLFCLLLSFYYIISNSFDFEYYEWKQMYGLSFFIIENPNLLNIISFNIRDLDTIYRRFLHLNELLRTVTNLMNNRELLEGFLYDSVEIIQNLAPSIINSYHNRTQISSRVQRYNFEESKIEDRKEQKENKLAKNQKINNQLQNDSSRTYSSPRSFDSGAEIEIDRTLVIK